MSWRKLLLWQVIGLVTLAILGTACATQAGRWLERADQLTAADAIIILGGEHKAFHRTQRALALYDKDYAPTVVFSGGTLLGAGLVCSSAALSLEAAVGMGFNTGAALIAEEAQSTWDEAINIQQLAMEQGWRSVIIVTNSYHTRRAGQTFESMLPTVQVMVTPAYSPDYEAARWWTSETGLQSVMNELMKLGFYWYRYGISPI